MHHGVWARMEVCVLAYMHCEHVSKHHVTHSARDNKHRNFLVCVWGGGRGAVLHADMSATTQVALPSRGETMGHHQPPVAGAVSAACVCWWLVSPTSPITERLLGGGLLQWMLSPLSGTLHTRLSVTRELYGIRRSATAAGLSQDPQSVMITRV